MLTLEEINERIDILFGDISKLRRDIATIVYDETDPPVSECGTDYDLLLMCLDAAHRAIRDIMP